MGLGHLKSSISSNVKPIRLPEFVNSLVKVLKFPDIQQFGRRDGIRGRKIGLAISGGVDSMALALLCSQVPKITLDQIPESARDSLKLFQDITFQAFVVDHGVREGSDIEARSVSKILASLGIPTKVLKIDWMQDSLANSSRFESLARKHRFRTLGLASRSFDINALLLAHHQDDQAETVFMRMVAGHRVTGLTGIKGNSEIPECYGIHGVHESGGIDDAIRHGDGVELSKSENEGPSKQLLVENGGVRVYRPLLDFSKARLRATCEEAKVDWFEDHTNTDPTLTMRNAVRHMYGNYVMPPALTKPAILKLSERCKQKDASRLDSMNTLLQKCCISRFETRSGILQVQFPPHLGRLEKISTSTSTSASEYQHLAASVLRRISMLVTPEEHISLSSLHGAVERIFPNLNPEESDKSRDNFPAATKFTVAGVQFEPQPQHNWLLSRQPFPSTLAKHPIRSVTPSLSPYPSSAPALALTPTPNAAWSSWHLFDGRFWLRTRHNYSSTELRIQPFSKAHLKEFTQSFNTQDRTRLRADLKRLAPGDIRWTLPAIVLPLQEGRERVLALPTLGFVVPDARGRVEWDARYKKVALEGLAFCQG